MERVQLLARPELRQPTLVAGFAGWPNAADVATHTVSHLVESLKATPLGSLSVGDCYDLTSTRPLARIQDGLIEEVTLPSNDLYYWRDDVGTSDLLLLSGVEPGLRWDDYIGALIAAAEQFGARRLVTLGGLYDRVPHTRPPRISAVVSRAELKDEVARLGCSFIDYTGPSSMHTTLLLAARQHGLDAYSLWAHAPHYAHMAWNPRVTYGLLYVLCGLLNVRPDLESVRSAATYLDEMMEKLSAENSDLKAHIAELEEEYADGQTVTEPLTPLSDSIIRDIEELLRGRPDEPDNRTL